MTMRTTYNFVCDNGHKGKEVTSENDQPYSDHWESTRTEGLIEGPNDARGYPTYLCQVCRLPMKSASA